MFRTHSIALRARVAFEAMIRSIGCREAQEFGGVPAANVSDDEGHIHHANVSDNDWAGNPPTLKHEPERSSTVSGFQPRMLEQPVALNRLALASKMPAPSLLRKSNQNHGRGHWSLKRLTQAHHQPHRLPKAPHLPFWLAPPAGPSSISSRHCSLGRDT